MNHNLLKLMVPPARIKLAAHGLGRQKINTVNFVYSKRLI